jgi:hypothetical protein
MEAEQQSAGCRRRQAHRVRPASAQIALRLREFVRLAESARHCGEPTERGAPSAVGAFLSDSFAEYTRRCGETTERGAPGVVGALLSDSFAEYVRFCVWFSFLFLCFGVISCVLFKYTWRSARNCSF